MPTSNTLCCFSLFNVLVAFVFTLLVWLRKHSGHIFCCYFLKKYGNQVGRLVRNLTMYLLVLFSLLCPPPTIFLYLLCLPILFFCFFLDFFFSTFASKTGSIPKPWDSMIPMCSLPLECPLDKEQTHTITLYVHICKHACYVCAHLHAEGR